MTAAKEFSKVWATLSKKILASILIDDGAVFPVHDIIGVHVSWFAPKERPIYEAVLNCITDNTPPTIEAVTVRVNGSTPKGYIRAIADLFNDDDNRHLIYNTEQLRQIGVLAEVRAFGRELSDLEAIEDISKTSDMVSTKLGGILAEAANRANDGASISDLAWREVERAQEPGIPTGLKWFDNIAGGLWRGMNYWIAAPYKSGKTTVMRNGVLNAASLNNPTGVFCAEGSREMFTLDCQAMLATGILMDMGWRGDNLRLSGLFIKRFYWQKGVLKKEELDAIHEAKEIWRGLPIYIWDTSDGIRDLATLRYLVKRGRVHYGIKNFWADYSQLFGSAPTIYERQSTTALTVQDIAQTENVAFCMLAQQNEAQIQSKNKGYSPGIKGGGEAPAAADFLLIPQIDPDVSSLLEIELKFSRHTKTGKGQHYLVPSCGLITDKWQ